MRFVPVDAATLVETTRLPEVFHNDPPDRLIVSLAKLMYAELLTVDEKITAYPHVNDRGFDVRVIGSVIANRLDPPALRGAENWPCCSVHQNERKVAYF